MRTDVHPPAWYIFMLPWTKLFGSDLFVIRFPSAVFGAVSIILIYVLATLESDRRTGLFAAGLLAFNGYHIFWSQIARPYSMVCFLGLLSSILLLLTLRGDRRRNLFLLSYIVVSAYGLATTYYFWLLFATHILWVLWRIWSRGVSISGFFRSQLFVLILSSPMIAIAIFQKKHSYLGSDIFYYLKQLVQFGFLFIPDTDALIQNPLPNTINAWFVVLSSILIFIGLFVKKKPFQCSGSDIWSPSMKYLLLICIFSFACILLAAKIFHSEKPERTPQILASSVFPFLIILFGFLCHRFSKNVRSLVVSIFNKIDHQKIPHSLASFLVVVPVVMITGISLIIPFFATQHMLIFVPFLLIALSRGTLSIFPSSMKSPLLYIFVVLVGFLALTHYLSIEYHKSRPQSPTGYKFLAEQWIPNIESSDLIFVQRHWVTTPIFYYLKSDRYRFVGRNYSEEITKNAGSRVWLLSFTGLRISKKIKDALRQYKLSTTITSLRTKALLYVPVSSDPEK
jgi:4-amino-4-deoxy-L-arabinose transferase-like glycosyltransferase